MVSLYYPQMSALSGVTHSKFPSHANDYIEDRIDLSRELIPSPMSTEQLVVVGDATSGVGLFDGDLVLFDRAKLPSPGRHDALRLFAPADRASI